MTFARSAFARLVASGGGIGLSPLAPGTVGSATAVLVGVGLLRTPHPALTLGVAVGLAIGAGLWSIVRAAAADDPGWVVIDEFAGQWIAMLPLARPSLAGCALAFALFRLFDIAKPGPVGWLDRRRGAWAVMADDVAAGTLAACCVGTALGAAQPARLNLPARLNAIAKVR